MVEIVVRLSYEQIVDAVNKLSGEQKHILLDHLMTNRPSTDDEWWALVERATISIPLVGTYSDRRSDWYDDDGR